MAEAKRYKVVAAESREKGTKHRVQLEIHDRLSSSSNKAVFIKNVTLDDVTAATVRTAARALIAEFKALSSPKESTGFSSYEEDFDRS